MAKAKRGFNFQTMEVKKPNYSKFNLSHDKLTCIAGGKLVPLWWTECIPGDRWNINLSSFVKLLPLSSPMFQRQDIFVRAFKVPKRILVNQEDLDIAYAGDKSGNHIDFPFVTCSPGLMTVGSLYDYLDLPLPYEYDGSSWSLIDQEDVTTSPEVSAFPFLAYQRIFHDHFRNEETKDEYLDMFKQRFEMFDDGDAPINAHSTLVQGAPYMDNLQSVCWERDYFTSALASTQRGTEVRIPLLGNASVQVPNLQSSDPTMPVEYQQTPFPHLQAHHDVGQSAQLNLSVKGSDFTGIGAIALRMAMNLQAFLERNNIAGYRMIGNILAHFGVMSSNRLMDEAEYIGGIKCPISIHSVSQTSASVEDSTPQGTQVGQGQCAFTDHLCSCFCEEPAILMVVAYVNAKSGYCQGLSRKWTRKNYLDEYWPEFQSVGEQDILTQELFFNFTQDDDYNHDTWAYQSRFAEYKYEPDAVNGEFRTSLSYWHQKRLFTMAPMFNDSFVKSDPSYRVFALNEQTYPRPYLCDFWFDVQVVRPMDKYASSKLW